MSDNIKLAYSKNEIASPSVVISTAQNPSLPVSATNNFSAEGSETATSEYSSAGTEEIFQEANQPTTSGSEIQSDEDVSNKTSSNIEVYETTIKISGVPASTKKCSSEENSEVNGEREFTEISDDALKILMKTTRHKLPVRKRQLQKAEELSGLASAPPGVGGKTKREQTEDATKLVILQRLSQLPVVECSVCFYRQVKGNQLFGGAIEFVESCVWLTLRPLAMTSLLIDRMCSTPVGVADWMLCKALDVAQTVCPCVAVPPNQMCGVMVTGAKNCVCCCPRTVASGMKGACEKAKRICN